MTVASRFSLILIIIKMLKNTFRSRNINLKDVFTKYNHTKFAMLESQTSLFLPLNCNGSVMDLSHCYSDKQVL